MTFAAFFANQARKPTGLFGRFVASQIFKKGNAEMNVFIFDSLSINAGDHVLEIGFGPCPHNPPWHEQARHRPAEKQASY